MSGSSRVNWINKSSETNATGSNYVQMPENMKEDESVANLFCALKISERFKIKHVVDTRAIYSGNFKNGQFHGKGVITYPVGHRLKCVHKNGKLIDQLFIFEDGLEVHDPNNYCQMPDRRFQVEFNTSLRGAGKEFLTNRQPTIQIPDGCYDTIDGFYVPSVKCIYKYDEESLGKGEDAHHKRRTDTLKRTALVQESKYIERNYRKSNIENIGYRPDLYECWVTGRRTEIDKSITDLNLVDKIILKDNGSLESNDSSEDHRVEIEFTQLRTTY